MKLPKMIMFDYGQTLIAEEKFNGIKGTEAVMEYAVRNKYNRTIEEIQEAANSINRELGRFNPETRHLFQVEVPNYMFTSYLYTSLGIELSISSEEIDRTFWNAASPGKVTEGIGDFLKYLTDRGIRTGVISNISYIAKVVKERINSLIPENEFEFIIATSDYMYRKPNRRIFEMALEMAELAPEDVWFIGDDYKCDILGAKEAGMYPVWYVGGIEYPFERKDDILTVQSWSELKKIMDEI